jgi:hypothetical protein
VWHLIRRLREYIRYYTYRPDDIHYSITQERKSCGETFHKIFRIGFPARRVRRQPGHWVVNLDGTRRFLLGSDVTISTRSVLWRPGGTSAHSPDHFDLLFYPPIAVLIVGHDSLAASRIDAG